MNDFHLVELTEDDTSGLELINTVTLMTTWPVVGDWILSRDRGHSMMFNIPPANRSLNYRDYWLAVDSQSYVTFHIRSCSYVRIVLSSIFGVVTDEVFEASLHSCIQHL